MAATSSSTGRRGNPAFGNREAGTGRSGNPGGKEKGTMDRWHKAQATAALSQEYTSLEWADAVARNDVEALKRMNTDPRDITPRLRLLAFHLTSPYIFRKLPQQVEVDVKQRRHVSNAVLERMNEEQLKMYAQVLADIGSIEADIAAEKDPRTINMVEYDEAQR